MNSRVSSNINFTQKKRLITPQIHNDLQTILTRMNGETKANVSEHTFNAQILTRLSIADKASLYDERLYMAQVPAKKQMIRNVTVKLKKIILTIDNQSGEIINYKKPIFTTWSNVMKKLEEVFATFKDHYNDPNIVKKRRIEISGFTTKGYKKLTQKK